MNIKLKYKINFKISLSVAYIVIKNYSNGINKTSSWIYPEVW